MKRRSLYRGIALLCAWVMTVSVFAGTAWAGAAGQTSPEEDFYRHVNGRWMEENEIPAHQVVIGDMWELSMNVESMMMVLFDGNVAQGKAKGTGPAAQMLSLYVMARDYKKRDELGLAPLAPFMQAIQEMSSLEELDAVIARVHPLANIFVHYEVYPDMADSSLYRLNLLPGNLTLDDKVYYADDTPESRLILSAIEAYYKELLTLAGWGKKEAATGAKAALEIEMRIAETMPLSTAYDDMADHYDVYDFEALDAQVQSLDLAGFVRDTGGQVPPKVGVSYLAYYRGLDALLVEENLSKIKAYMLVQLLAQDASILTSEIARAEETFYQTIFGYSGKFPLEGGAMQFVQSLFPFAAGEFYVRFFFSAEAKAEVTGMVEALIENFERRITALDWMSEATKERALRKLETMTLKIGYPESYPDPFRNFEVIPYEAGGNLVTNMLEIDRHYIQYLMEQLGRPVDKTLWEVPPQTVNAYYSASANEIIFPAAFLQWPYYDVSRSMSENYGAIGTVIGHEITHAFDINGAQFDEYGNKLDWWGVEDRLAFGLRTLLLTDQFNQAEVGGHKLDGTLTLAENIADLGGLACALDVAQRLPDFDADAFFRAYALQWREKVTPEYDAYRLLVDEHAPAEARVNVQLPNFALFHETYGIQMGDPMYRPEKKRIQIW